MALAPQTGDDTGADTDPDDGAGAAPADMGDTDAGQSDVLVTIARGPAGGYLVYAGDEPDGGEGGAEPQHADSIGQALKAALDILNEAASSAGEPGGSDDQLSAGYGMSREPTPAAKPRGRMAMPPQAAGV